MKFKVGDRVKIMYAYDDLDAPVGSLGTVKDFSLDEPCTVYVSLDKNSDMYNSVYFETSLELVDGTLENLTYPEAVRLFLEEDLEIQPENSPHYKVKEVRDLFRLETHHVTGYWEAIIREEPELYWQWRAPMDSGGGRIEPRLEKLPLTSNFEKHAGPWIKTEDGFKKHDDWEQF